MKLGPVDYSKPVAPSGYRCGCGTHNVKLWREYQTFADYTALFCAQCAERRYAKSHEGKSPFARGEGDQIGWLVPAVPTAEGDTYWGYTSVPIDGVNWWQALP